VAQSLVHPKRFTSVDVPIGYEFVTESRTRKTHAKTAGTGEKLNRPKHDGYPGNL